MRRKCIQNPVHQPEQTLLITAFLFPLGLWLNGFSGLLYVSGMSSNPLEFVFLAILTVRLNRFKPD
jgi:hypothetical protein